MSFNTLASIRHTLPPELCTKLDALEKEYGQIEVKQVNERQVCLRIHVRIRDEVTPIAAIGKSIEQAVERLQRLSKTIIPTDDDHQSSVQ